MQYLNINIRNIYVILQVLLQFYINSINHWRSWYGVLLLSAYKGCGQDSQISFHIIGNFFQSDDGLIINSWLAKQLFWLSGCVMMLASSGRPVRPR